MDKELRFIQFIHPGGEHVPDRGREKDWNKGPHRRKFLKCPGTYIQDDRPVNHEIVFWGEWEPESEVVTDFGRNAPSYPRWLYRPFLRRRESYAGLQNTDPFVFGDRFYYSNCMQLSSDRPNAMQHLERGSVIVFGSHSEGHFVMDTVFVVAGSVEMNEGSLRRLKSAVPAAFYHATVLPLFAEVDDPKETRCGCNSRRGKCNPAEQSYRLYWGATPEVPVDEMFSYFPCLPYKQNGIGFPRPRIQLAGHINPSLRQGRKQRTCSDLEDAKSLWECVRDQVRDHHLKLGVNAALPPFQ